MMLLLNNWWGKLGGISLATIFNYSTHFEDAFIIMENYEIIIEKLLSSPTP